MTNKQKRRAVSESSSGSEFQQEAGGGAATDESDSGEGSSTVVSPPKRRLKSTRASKRIVQDSDSGEELKQKEQRDNKQDESEEEDNPGPPVTPSPKKRGRPKFVQPNTDSDSPSPSPSKKRKVAGTGVPTTPSSSPRKRANRKGAGTPSLRKQPKPLVQPEEMWRRSDIPTGLTVTKGNAQKLFRLTPADLNSSGIRFERQSRGRLQGEMHLYRMREVERVAWKKHGGPEGFAAMMKEAKEKWVERGNDPFHFLQVPYPFQYERSARCKGCGSIFHVPTHLIIDKCDRCRGIKRGPSVIITRLPRPPSAMEYVSWMGIPDDYDYIEAPYGMEYEDYDVPY